jgi:DNA-directed RNA polymerase subunit RPC12/RpoP
MKKEKNMCDVCGIKILPDFHSIWQRNKDVIHLCFRCAAYFDTKAHKEMGWERKSTLK